VDDQLIIKLNNIEILNENTFQTSSSIYRKNDNKHIASIFSVKQK